LKLIIEDTNMKPYIATISIFNNDKFIDGYYLTEIQDKRKEGK